MLTYCSRDSRAYGRGEEHATAAAPTAAHRSERSSPTRRGCGPPVERVVTGDRATPHDYDHRWVALHGMGASAGAAPLARPAAEWPAIAERTRAEYLRGLDQVLDGR